MIDWEEVVKLYGETINQFLDESKNGDFIQLQDGKPLSEWYIAGFFTFPSARNITVIPILSAPLSFSISFTNSASRCPNMRPSSGKHAGK